MKVFLIDEVSLTAMLLDAIMEVQETSKEHDTIAIEVIQEHLDRGEIKEL